MVINAGLPRTARGIFHFLSGFKTIEKLIVASRRKISPNLKMCRVMLRQERRSVPTGLHCSRDAKPCKAFRHIFV